jgi:hypothetical protein
VLRDARAADPHSWQQLEADLVAVVISMPLAHRRGSVKVLVQPLKLSMEGDTGIERPGSASVSA